ncbi:cytochrome c biogenesis protein [Roseimaritima ulvae]|uniref:Cytochrome c biogenesis protein CcsA n=1 Tax=Roseimaritima ulvae TaxID=980254 RepID=A0A5B9R921_9BACT|nr:cytochrome c biogenesis protein CcsA [Roseimaritima ulvae]QEG43243.1 Cytochrome c biogenesis protein CcsA [Roseimaritima ulvae]
MANTGAASQLYDTMDRHHTEVEPEQGPLRFLLAVLRPLGSLKWTIILFAVSLVLVMAGTLSQESLNMEQVKQRYFTSWIAKLYIDDFIPQVFYKHEPFYFWLPFPGGALVGTLLLVNLLAAKITRFHARARGGRLAAGLAALAIGFALMLAVIITGGSSEGVQGEPPMSYPTLWKWVCGGLAAAWVGLLAVGVTADSPRRRNWSIAGVVVMGALLIGMLTGYMTLSDPGLRILWQLLKGTGVAMIMMLGCHLIFDKQGGNVLLHFGVALLMVGQFAYGDRQVEQKLQLAEGDVSNTLINTGKLELAFIDNSNPAETKVVGIPGSRLRAAHEWDSVISDPAVPFDVKVPAFYINSKLVDPNDLPADKPNLATTGQGLELAVEEARMQGGATGGINVASAYVELLSKDSGESLGTYLVTQFVNDGQSLFVTPAPDEFESVTVGDTTYEMGLRFQRIVKPYWVKLLDVRRNDYAGDTKAQSFSSVIRLVDPRNDENRKERIWMNNPLRYRGETFYQADHVPVPGGKERTGLQVVQNSGWLIPYLACSITGVGMLFHFLGSLNRYTSRHDRETHPKLFFPVAMSVAVAFVTLIVSMKLIPWSAVAMAMNPDRAKTTRDLYRAGEIPVQFGGRLMPLDAYARLTLKTLSSKESVPLTEAGQEMINRYAMEEVSPSAMEKYRDPGMREKRLPALQWLMEVSADSDEIYDLPMIRIDAAEVLAEVGIERRRKSKLYSLSELMPASARVREMATKANEKDSAQLSFKERKIIELASRLHLYDVVSISMQMPTPRQIPDELLRQMFASELAGREITDEFRQLASFEDLRRRMELIAEIPSPGLIPQQGQAELPRPERERWLPLSNAYFESIKDRLRDPEAVDPTAGFMTMVKAYQDNDPLAFNQAIDQHDELIRPRMAEDETGWKLTLERWMEATWPSGTAMILYLIVLVLALAHLLSGVGALRASAWAMLIGILVVHTFAIVARIVITERPPVINLYSSAVFIGWAAVLYGVVIEYLGRRGIGNLLAAAAGSMTLMIALRGLSGDDTMPVLEAVLDTQFWLGTHVITVTLGYSATFASGLLGIIYLVQSWAGAEQQTRKEVYRMMYGVTCFGILFSFIGTVLGGLWADDSWGRFWGWDPKENGALLIVIWNALMLHARWDKMVGPRGFAMLAIGGNIVTAWSWFGTNQLGFGLHSYGFTSGTMMWLGLFVASQIALIVLGAVLPTSKPPQTEGPGWENKRI